MSSGGLRCKSCGCPEAVQHTIVVGHKALCREPVCGMCQGMVLLVYLRGILPAAAEKNAAWQQAAAAAALRAASSR